MDGRTGQEAVIKRLGEQITDSFKWAKNQWQTNPLTFVIVIILVGSIVWAGCLRFVKGRGWADWTEFGEYTDPTGEYYRAKTLWDLLELLIIPIVLAVGAWWLNKSERENELRIAEDNRKEDRRIAEDRRHQATLEAYFDRMVELIAEHNLLGEEPGEKRKVLSTIARTRTLAVLRSLDGERKGHVVQFLYESGLIGPEPVVVLRGADLADAILDKANLEEANLAEVSLARARLGRYAMEGGANLNKATLVRANLSEANLLMVHLEEADLSRANLERANLKEAKLNRADLASARLVEACLEMALLEGACLEAASLDETNSHRVILTGANLYKASLTEADLESAVLAEANLKEANLPSAKLSGANLHGADLRWANLFKANLKEANLEEANLEGTDLRLADLTDANLAGTNVTDEQLAGAKSLKGTTMPNGTEHE